MRHGICSSCLGLPGRGAKTRGPFVHYYERLREAFLNREWAFLRRMCCRLTSRTHRSDPQRRSTAKCDATSGSPARGSSGSSPSKASAPRRLASWTPRSGPGSTSGFARIRRCASASSEPPAAFCVDMLMRAAAGRHDHPETPAWPIASFRCGPTRQRCTQRIETYISRYYDAYMSGDKAQKPLGFIMTVYRRRLTSSFLAIELSLQRRLKALHRERPGGRSARRR